MRWTLKRDGGAGSRGHPAGRGSVHNRPGASSGQQPGAKARVRTPEPNHQPPSLGGHPPPGTCLPRREARLGAPWAEGSQWSWKRASGGAPRKQTRAGEPARLHPPAPRAQETNTSESLCFRLFKCFFVSLEAGEQVREGGVQEPPDRPARMPSSAGLSPAPACRHTSAPETPSPTLSVGMKIGATTLRTVWRFPKKNKSRAAV